LTFRRESFLDLALYFRIPFRFSLLFLAGTKRGQHH
jgi:hypothetical protein